MPCLSRDVPRVPCGTRGGLLGMPRVRSMSASKAREGNMHPGANVTACAQCRHGLLVSHASGQHDTEVVPGDRQVRLQLAGVPQGGHGGIVFAGGTEQGAQGVVVKHVLRALGQGLVHAGDGRDDGRACRGCLLACVALPGAPVPRPGRRRGAVRRFPRGPHRAPVRQPGSASRLGGLGNASRASLRTDVST